jgi:hypothetical protein
VPAFKVKVGNRSYYLKIFGSGGQVTLNRFNHQADFLRVSSYSCSSILDGRSFQFCLWLDQARAIVVHARTELPLSVEDECSLLLRGFEEKSSQRRAGLEIQAPMLGW